MHFQVDSFFNNQKHSTLAPRKFSFTIFLRIESAIWRPKSVSIKRVAKTIMLHCGNVENCEDTSASMVERGEIKRKGRTYCVARAPSDVNFKINTHIPDISIHRFPKGVAVGPQWTRSRRNRGDFTIQCRWPHDPYRCYNGFWTSYPPPPSKSASEYEPPPPSNFPFKRRLYHIC